MLNRASLKHNNVFKQPCYRALLLERIVYVFPLSLLLQPETLLAVPRCTNPGHVALPKKESSRERRSVTMVRSSRIFRTKCRYIMDATENFVT